MKIQTQFDQAIVEAAGIDTRQYSEAEISDFATKLVFHPEVQARAKEILTRSVAAQVITEILSNGATANAKTASLHNLILKECGQPPLKLK